MRGAPARASGSGFGLLVARLLVACAALALGGVAQALDANTASADELQTLRGIGPATAARIVEARQREPFRDLDDLRDRVRGIGEKKLRKLQQAGLAVGSGQVGEGPGRARVIEPALARRADGRRSVEWHVGRAR
ncbi:MAG: helix-hairpin-helix domain-containing protein [Burkholderiaceae bacterium]|nr:helix-hairpin-helix domain-containing protein [Burkholderiaceae bacterium]